MSHDYLFFFSYARDNDDPHLQSFFEDLEKAVRDLSGRQLAAAVGFRDQREIKVGDEWPRECAMALATARTLVCVYSPVYFSKSYCGKEVDVFLQRRRFHQDRHPGAAPPSVVLPIIWLPCKELIPDVVRELQFPTDSYGSEYDAEGLQFIKTLKRFDDQYREFLRKFARRVVEAATKHALAPLDPPPEIHRVRSAFDVSSGPCRVAPSKSAGGPNAVSFIYATLSAERAWTWTPYPPPEENQIGKLSFSIALSRSFKPQELPLDDQIVERLKEASARNEIVVILVDSLSLSGDSLRRTLQQYDQVSYANAAALVIWPPTIVDREASQIEQLIKHTFANKRATTKAIYFRTPIKSGDELKQALEETLMALQMEILSRADDIGAPPSRQMPFISVPGVTPVKGADNG